ncbi:MAG: ABC transporter substrate-binding protein, partial [Candidatus Saccharibacteria bacterium]|nr:ABC transporter substrate-binding protein [Moraxellaceae bacterium]
MSLLNTQSARRTLLASLLALTAYNAADAAPLKIGYSDWPGWV